VRLPAQIRVDVPSSDERRDAIEEAVLDRVAALRAATEAPAGDARRDQIERRVFERVDAIRCAERSDFLVPMRERPRWVPWLAGACAAAAAAVVLVLVIGRDAARPSPTPIAERTRVVTPAGGTSRFVTGDAVIDAGSDTSVEVVPGAGGAITLELARGSVDCDVTPRAGRPAFVVVAGDTRVEVVGTRFTVARTPAVRVDVTRGKVRVVTPTETRVVIAGESWSATTVTAVVPDIAPRPVPPDEPAEPDEIELEPEDARATKPSTRQSYEAAKRLVRSDRRAAKTALRNVAAGRGKYAGLALFDLITLEQDSGNTDQALRAADEYVRRFPSARTVDDAMYLRVEILREANRLPEARVAATAYLKRFPNGVYAEQVRPFANP
jgi:ferric-dicitrate binding protein FerR (iron transport regulator)